MSQQKSNYAYADVWGVKEVYYGICAGSEWPNELTESVFAVTE